MNGDVMNQVLRTRTIQVDPGGETYRRVLVKFQEKYPGAFQSAQAQAGSPSSSSPITPEEQQQLEELKKASSQLQGPTQEQWDRANSMNQKLNDALRSDEIDKILLNSMIIPSPPPTPSPGQILQNIINYNTNAPGESSQPIAFNDNGVLWTRGGDGKWKADKESNIPGSRNDAQMKERGWKPDSSAPATTPALTPDNVASEQADRVSEKTERDESSAVLNQQGITETAQTGSLPSEPSATQLQTP